ncbi:hypothetical protein POL68_21720 [Stigmatella sp. ncwal1]|uniref:Immunity MXAN-0049 protein domain-containing protein n=1 Tax=Stigmatella ashevillensis TaxID=2995309 RepID=A0ABT5DDB7_9BACT|nr:DUF1629 domain-containing protein [Stigmatella ashevillena]MDC0711103.1 hypothetical protein [Stigmatella ashevillena]
MSRRFFELSDDVSFPRRWHLSFPRSRQGREFEDPIQFNRGHPVDVEGPLQVSVEHAGSPLDFSEAGAKVPIVHVKVASIFAEQAPEDVQLIPVNVEGQPDQYLVLVATRLIRCIDEKASQIRLWTHADGLPEMAGTYASVRDMRIAKTQVGKAKVFRPEGWEVALIVSGEIREALERKGATGARFEEV